jgi:hypothetical protein
MELNMESYLIFEAVAIIYQKGPTADTNSYFEKRL